MILSYLWFVIFLFFLVLKYYIHILKLLLIFKLRSFFLDQITFPSINNVRYAWRVSSYHKQLELPSVVYGNILFNISLPFLLDSASCKLKVPYSEWSLVDFCGFLLCLSPDISFSSDDKNWQVHNFLCLKISYFSNLKISWWQRWV